MSVDWPTYDPKFAKSSLGMAWLLCVWGGIVWEMTHNFKEELYCKT